MYSNSYKQTEWVGFPTDSLLNPIESPYNFTNPLSKSVFLLGDPNYVSKHVVQYLDTTLHVSGFKVTKFTSLSETPLFWTTNDNKHIKMPEKNHKNYKNEFWKYTLDLSDFDCILIPSQINGDIWNDISEETKIKINQFVEKGGSLICCHFRATNIINSVCNVSWHEISVRVGTSFHMKKKEKDILKYKNDVRAIVNVNKNNIIYKTANDFVSVAYQIIGNGIVYYIGHDFNAIAEKKWNKILFNSIKKILTNSDKQKMNLNFGSIDIEAFKHLSLNISNNNNNETKDIYLDEFEPEFDDNNNNNNHNEQSEQKQIAKSFDEFDEFNEFDAFDGFDRKKEYESIGYIQMDDNGIILLNKKEQEDDDERLEEVD